MQAIFKNQEKSRNLILTSYVKNLTSKGVNDQHVQMLVQFLCAFYFPVFVRIVFCVAHPFFFKHVLLKTAVFMCFHPAAFLFYLGRILSLFCLETGFRPATGFFPPHGKVSWTAFFIVTNPQVNQLLIMSFRSFQTYLFFNWLFFVI